VSIKCSDTGEHTKSLCIIIYRDRQVFISKKYVLTFIPKVAIISEDLIVIPRELKVVMDTSIQNGQLLETSLLIRFLCLFHLALFDVTYKQTTI